MSKKITAANRNIVDAIGTLINLSAPLNQKFAGYDDFADFVKNLFADSFGLSPYEQRDRHREIFSFVSNNAEIPDFMLRGGDVVEIKTVRLKSGEYDPVKCSPIEFNTVFPRQKLFFDDPLVTDECRRAESWYEKDVVYVVGALKRRQLIHLCMIYGVDYCAGEKYYSGLNYELKKLIAKIRAARFPYTRELARIGTVDPTGATYLKLYGMWHVENPWSFFRYVCRPNPNANFSFMCIINREKFHQLDNGRKLFAWAKDCDGLRLAKIRVKNPDAPDTFRDALLIRYEI